VIRCRLQIAIARYVLKMHSGTYNNSEFCELDAVKICGMIELLGSIPEY
jgi:hypothetical protein